MTWVRRRPIPSPYLLLVTYGRKAGKQSWPEDIRAGELSLLLTQESRFCTSPEQYNRADPAVGVVSEPVPKM